MQSVTGPDRRGPSINTLFPGRQFAQGLWETGTAPTSSTPTPAGSYLVYPKHKLGTIRYLEDGRVFAYALNGVTALTPGQLCQTPIPSSSYNTLAVLAAANVDSANMVKQVSVNQAGANWAQNAFQDGFMFVADVNGNASNGAGNYYKIRSNPAANSNSSNSNWTTLTLYDDIQTSLPTTANVSLVPSPYSQVVAWDASNSNARPAGIAPIAVAANAYFWLQVAGACGAIANTALVQGQAILPSNKANGAVMGANALGVNANAAPPGIGYAINIGATGKGCFVYLTIAG